MYLKHLCVLLSEAHCLLANDQLLLVEDGTHHASLCACLAGNLAVRVVLQAGVQNCIRDLQDRLFTIMDMQGIFLDTAANVGSCAKCMGGCSPPGRKVCLDDLQGGNV